MCSRNPPNATSVFFRFFFHSFPLRHVPPFHLSLPSTLVVLQTQAKMCHTASACLFNKGGGKKNLKLKFAGFQSWLVDNSYIFHMLLFFILCPFSISILMLRLFLFFFDGGRSATLNTSLGPPVSAAADVASRVIRIEIVFLHLPVLVAGVASIALSPCRSLVGRV